TLALGWRKSACQDNNAVVYPSLASALLYALQAFAMAGNATSSPRTRDSRLPAWLSFDASTRTFSGTPQGFTGTLALKVTASDGALTASDVFSVAISLNHAPVATIGDHSVRANEWVQVKNWLSVSDADGNAITQYQFLDAGRLRTAAIFGHRTIPTIRPTPRLRWRRQTSTMCGCGAARWTARRRCRCVPSTAATGALGISSR